MWCCSDQNQNRWNHTYNILSTSIPKKGFFNGHNHTGDWSSRTVHLYYEYYSSYMYSEYCSEYGVRQPAGPAAIACHPRRSNHDIPNNLCSLFSNLQAHGTKRSNLLIPLLVAIAANPNSYATFTFTISKLLIQNHPGQAQSVHSKAL